MTEIPENLVRRAEDSRASATVGGTEAGFGPLDGPGPVWTPPTVSAETIDAAGGAGSPVPEGSFDDSSEGRRSSRFGLVGNVASAVRQTRVGKVATNAAMAFAVGWAGNNINPISDASNVKSGIATASLAFSGAMLGKNNWSEFGKAVKPTVAGIGGAAATGFFLGNIFTGGWHEQGSVGLAAAGAAIAGVSATGVKIVDVKNNRDSRPTGARRARSRRLRPIAAIRAIPGLAGEHILDGRSYRTKKVVKSLGFGAGALVATEASNALNWPFGGFNHIGVALSAAAVSTGVYFGEDIKERFDDLSPSGKKTAKILAAGLGFAAIVGGVYAWNKGWIGGHGHGKSGDHTDKVPASNPRGGSSTSTSLTPSTTGSTSTTVTTTTAPIGAGTGTSTGAGSGGAGSSFTLPSFSSANKPGMVAKIQELQPGIAPAKANTIADQILADQYKGVTEHGDKFAAFISKVTQPQADAMFRHDVSVLAS